MPVFDFKDASLSGDPQWSSISRYTSHAPLLVLNLLLLSILQIILGTIYIVNIQSLPSANLTFAQVIQPLIVPGLSFFNTIPSLHLHVLARSNTPLMAIVFSSIMGLLYFASAVVYLPPCISSTTLDSGYKRTECPTGSPRGLWAAQVALQFLSAIGYTAHMGMAVWVRRTVRKRERDEREGRVLVVIDEEGKRRREAEARRRWMEIRDL